MRVEAKEGRIRVPRRPVEESHALRASLYRDQGGRCWWCGLLCLSGVNPETEIQRRPVFTLDHIQPLNDGGTNEKSNIVGACHCCNEKRNLILNLAQIGKDITDMLPCPEMIRFQRLAFAYEMGDKLRHWLMDDEVYGWMTACGDCND